MLLVIFVAQESIEKIIVLSETKVMVVTVVLVIIMVEKNVFRSRNGKLN